MINGVRGLCPRSAMALGASGRAAFCDLLAVDLTAWRHAGRAAIGEEDLECLTGAVAALAPSACLVLRWVEGEPKCRSGLASRDHTAVNQKALALLDKLKVKPEDNDTSKSLAGAAAKKRQELSKLSGAAFDKAYAQNEVAYHQTVNGANSRTCWKPASNSSRSIKSMPSTS